jgi:ferritin
MKETIQEAMNAQIQEEFASAYLYLGMAGYADSQNWQGMGHWLRLQWQEELFHAQKLFDFLLKRGGKVKLSSIPAPKTDFGAPLALFEEVLAHEQHITASIHSLYALAVKEHDYPLQTLLHWYIQEQVEEEDNATQIIEKFRLVGDTGPNLYLIDQELKQRQLGTEEATA